VSQGLRNLSFLAALALVVVGLAYALASRATEPRDPLAMAPVRTVAVVEVDVPGLRSSALWASLVGEGDDGMRRIRRTCGFDPLAQLRTVDVFLLREPDADAEDLGASLDEVAFVARGELDHEALVACIGEVVAGDGGGVHATEIEGVDALASDTGSSVAAFYGRDGIVAGADVVVAELLRIRQGASPPVARDEGLARLWARTAARRHARLVAVLPRNWQRFVGRLAELTGDLSPLGSARALGLGATLGEGVAITLAIELEDHRTAEAAADALRDRVADALRDPELSVSALAIALRRIDLGAEGQDLVVRVELDRAELDATVALARRYLAGDDADQPGPAEAPSESELPAPVPGERLDPDATPASP
jgi:hypothetical protein